MLASFDSTKFIGFAPLRHASSSYTQTRICHYKLEKISTCEHTITSKTTYLTIQISQRRRTPTESMLPPSKQLKPHKGSVHASAVREKSPADYIPQVCPGILLHCFIVHISQAFPKVFSNPMITYTDGLPLYHWLPPYESNHNLMPSIRICAKTNRLSFDGKSSDQRNILQSDSHLPSIYNALDAAIAPTCRGTT